MERSRTFPVFVVISTGFIFLSYKSIPQKHDGNNMIQLTSIVTKSKEIHQTMVSVSHPNCRKLFQIESLQQEQFPQDYQNLGSLYMRLSMELPPTAVDKGLMAPTRLQVTNGSLPYLPCRVQLYDSKKLHRCFLHRNSNDQNDSDPHDKDRKSINSQDNAKTWIAFVGDSKMRGKFAAMVLSLKDVFNWTARWDAGNNGQYVKVDLQFLVTEKTLNSMRVVSTDGLMQIDFVAATRGVRFWLNKSTLKKSNRNRPISLLHQWATTTEDIPHLIVIGHGLWSFMQLYVSFLAPFDDLLKEWKQTAEFLINLSARTNIIVWKQSRKRDFATLDYLKGNKFEMEHIIKNYLLSKQALEWVDFTMQSVLQRSGLTLWDSSMPMNIANIRECTAIREVLQGGYKDYNNIGDNKEIHTIESLERKPRRDNNSPESINARYDILLKILIDNSLDLRSTHEISKAKTYNVSKYNGDTPYNNYINYLLDVLQTMPFQDLETLYYSYVLNCKDGVHNSELTVQDETTMIYNLLCNQYEPKQDDLCCQL